MKATVRINIHIFLNIRVTPHKKNYRLHLKRFKNSTIPQQPGTNNMVEQR